MIKNIYRHRHAIVKAMGYSSYSEYLKGKEWKRIRSIILEIYPRCVCCHRKATQVHHASYSIAIMRGHKLSGLYGVCKKCHEKAEWSNGKKRTIDEANQYLGIDHDWHETQATTLAGGKDR